MNELSTSTNTGDIIFNDSKTQQLFNFAAMMASGVSTIPKHLQGNTSDCMAVCMQAVKWGMSPYDVAKKTFLVNGIMGYEAQLINAVITTSNAIEGRFHYEYDGGWKDDKDATAWCRVGAKLKGESEIQWGEPVYPAKQKVKNSPLWQTDPKQQTAYLAIKKWARLYAPALILGVYTKDETEEIARQERDVTPTKSVSEMMQEKALPKSEVVNEENKPEIKKVSEKQTCTSLMKYLADAKTLVDLSGVLDTIEAQLSGKNKDKMLEAYGKRLIQVSNKSPMFFIEEMVHQSQYAAISEMINSMEPDKAAKHMDALEQKTESLINSK